MNDFKTDDILKDKQDHDRMPWMEELRMTPDYQVFIMVLVQGATRSGFTIGRIYLSLLLLPRRLFPGFHQGTFFSFFSFFLFLNF